jgi:5-methylcytosine-specific restriction endonuclease McrBC regulatory subunit McrC
VMSLKKEKRGYLMKIVGYQLQDRETIHRFEKDNLYKVVNYAVLFKISIADNVRVIYQDNDGKEVLVKI